MLAMATELERLGQRVVPSAAELAADGSLSRLTIHPDRAALRRVAALGPVEIRTYEDHRMAMSFGVLGAIAGGVVITDPACTAKTYPGFWHDLAAFASGPDQP